MIPSIRDENLLDRIARLLTSTFNDVVIGGGYATELEPLALLLPSAPRGRLAEVTIEKHFR
jgi:hypothetical protein